MPLSFFAAQSFDIPVDPLKHEKCLMLELKLKPVDVKGDSGSSSFRPEHLQPAIKLDSESLRLP